MSSSSRGILFLACPALLALACGNSSSSGGAQCAAYQSSADLTTPAISMKTDVQPIIDRACTFTSCHGGGTGKLTMVMGDSSKTRTALVGVAAPEMPSMKLVAASDPTNSWMMKKLDGDVCLFTSKCTVVEGRCDDTMPQSGDILDVSERDKIRRWIAQGAKDN
jgi:hypothetical protein